MSSTKTPCGILMPRTCWKPGRISARFSFCWVIRTWKTPRFIFICRSNNFTQRSTRSIRSPSAAMVKLHPEQTSSRETATLRGGRYHPQKQEPDSSNAIVTHWAGLSSKYSPRLHVAELLHSAAIAIDALAAGMKPSRTAPAAIVTVQNARQMPARSGCAPVNANCFPAVTSTSSSVFRMHWCR